MPKRKKYPRLPNAYGSIRFLGKNRTNCYAVHPPCTEINDLGDYVRPKAICYVDDWYVGFAVLNAWHAGTYKPGDEITFKSYRAASSEDLDAFCARILNDHTSQEFVKKEAREKEKTFAEVYEAFYEWKYGDNAKKKLSSQSRYVTKAAYNYCSSLYDKAFCSLRYRDLQDVIDACPKKSSTKANIVGLMKQMYSYADLMEWCDKNWSEHVTIGESDSEEHGVAFTEQELRILWMHKDNETVELLLIMCYSGFRITAYKTITVNRSGWYFQGGIKTPAGKGRIVPIHSAIRALVETRLERDGSMLSISVNYFREKMYSVLDELGIRRHTPHDCRHTFSALCEKYEVKENDRKRMLGHSFGNDITNGVYGHRTLEELRTEIEKIQLPKA